MPGAIALGIGALASASGGGGGGKRKKQRDLGGFSTEGGFSAGITGGKKKRNVTITRSSGLSQNLASLQARLGERSAAFRDLRTQVGGAFSDVIRGRVDAIREAGSRTVGNLREELGKRRVLGSTFAQREISSIESSFAQEEARQRSEGALAQLGVESQLIAQEFEGGIQAAMAMIEQGNFESTLAANLQTNSASLAQAQRQADQQASAAGTDQLLEVGGAIAAYFFG